MTRTPDLPRAAAMAARVLLARHVDALPVDPVSLLQACRDTCVYSLPAAVDALDMPRGQLESLFAAAEAVTLRQHAEGTVRYAVVYRTDGHPARLRFTLAHELGHRLLGHTGADAAEEQEADCFASHLLCPEPVLRALAREGGSEDAGRIATACYVSYTCARVALNRPPLPVDPALTAALADLLAPVLKSLQTRRQKPE